MAFSGVQVKDDSVCELLDAQTSLDWWEAWGVWHGYDAEQRLKAVIAEGEGDQFGCIVLASPPPLLTITGDLDGIAYFLQHHFPKQGD